jgi:hypothetical protein
MFEGYDRYLKDNPQGLWFKAKLYGWGWVPVKWQGWTVVLVYLAAVFLLALTVDENSSGKEMVFTFFLPLALLTLTLLRICYKKGEKPKWQWGLPEKYKK